MIRATILAALIAWPVAAQDAAPYDDGARIGLTIHNRVSQGAIAPIEVETAAGLVVIVYTPTPGGAPGGCCDDHVEVWHVPEGWIAVPADLMVPEGETAFIELRRYLGG